MLLVLVIALWLSIFTGFHCTLTEQQCFDQIYNQCTHESTFTTKEIQTTQLYLKRRFAVTLPDLAACPISATNPPCIRKDIKCLSPDELQNLTSAWVQLYTNGVIANLTKLHYDYWGANHKFCWAFRNHFHFILQLEKELQKLNPAICMPYWNYPLDFAYPEKSGFWDIFGHAGNASNDYCVPDGPFANVTCDFPSEHCLRRQWQLNNTIYAWKGPEWYTYIQQMVLDPALFFALVGIYGQTDTVDTQVSPEMVATFGNALPYLPLFFNPTKCPFAQRVLAEGVGSHFDTHLSCGGLAGDMSYPYAPNDPSFHMFHLTIEVNELLWQLSANDGTYLLPLTYNVCVRYNNVTGKRTITSLETDTYNEFPDAYVKHSFQYGYGEQCHLYDVIIKPINYLVNQNLLLEAKYPFTYWLYACVPTLSPPLPPLPSTATLPTILRPLCSPPPLPTAAQRLSDALGPIKFRKYFPKFASNKWYFFDHTLPDISADCNPVGSACRTMPRAPYLTETPEGTLQYEAFGPQVADFNTQPISDVMQEVYTQFMDDLDAGGYCSPYV